MKKDGAVCQKAAAMASAVKRGMLKSQRLQQAQDAGRRIERDRRHLQQAINHREEKYQDTFNASMINGQYSRGVRQDVEAYIDEATHDAMAGGNQLGAAMERDREEQEREELERKQAEEAK